MTLFLQKKKERTAAGVFTYIHKHLGKYMRTYIISDGYLCEGSGIQAGALMYFHLLLIGLLKF